MSGGAIGRLAIASGDALRGPDGQSLFVGRYGDADGPLGRFADSVIARDWPGAVRLKTGAFGFDVSPHAGVGRSGGGGSQKTPAPCCASAAASATTDQAARTRWFLFASTDQQTLGTGFLRGEDAWKRAGLGPDPGATIADTRAGLAWRGGPFEASVGYLYREIKPRDLDMLDVQATHESLLGFRLSFHPASAEAGVARLGPRGPARRRPSDLPEAQQHVAFGRQVVGLVVEPRRVGEQQIVVLHLLRPPVTGAGVVQDHRPQQQVPDA